MTYKDVVKFHGHSCPGLAMGYRMTRIALKYLLSGRAEDEELVAIVENDACGVDAVQCLAGCTFGKGNLIFRDYGKQVYTFFSRKSGKAVRVALNEGSYRENRSESREERIHWLLNCSEEEVCRLRDVAMDPPGHAKRVDSVACIHCGEKVMATRTRDTGEGPVCIPCSEHQALN